MAVVERQPVAAARAGVKNNAQLMRDDRLVRQVVNGPARGRTLHFLRFCRPRATEKYFRKRSPSVRSRANLRVAAARRRKATLKFVGVLFHGRFKAIWLRNDRFRTLDCVGTRLGVGVDFSRCVIAPNESFDSPVLLQLLVQLVITLPDRRIRGDM